MTSVPLGRGAWKRLYAGEPEVQLLNRWVEENPANLREGVALLARPGTTPHLTLDPGPDWNPTLPPMRGQYVLNGLFDDALFVVCGNNLYKIEKGGAPLGQPQILITDGGDVIVTEGSDPITTEGTVGIGAEDDPEGFTVTLIDGIIHGTGYPEVAWSKGIGYEQLWIADGTILQYYAGTSYANGTLTKTGTITSGSDTVQIGGVYYSWNSSVNAGTPDGTAAFPYRVLVGADPFANLVKAIMFIGAPGIDYSSTIGGPNLFVTASVDADNPITVINVVARERGTEGNFISTTSVTGTATSWSGAFLANGGIEALQGTEVPDGQTVISVTQLSGYILLAVTDSQVFYWINPGEIVINPLNFASKESSPDNIVAMRTVGDQALIMGSKSTENWYATGNIDAPFAPIEGRVYQRGVYSGTAVVVDEAVLLIGDDGRVYSIGYQAGADAGFGIQRISNNGIEERIRRQIRREEGLQP